MRRMVEKSSTIKNFMSVGVLMAILVAFGLRGVRPQGAYRAMAGEVEGSAAVVCALVGSGSDKSTASVGRPKKRSSASWFITMMLMRRFTGLNGSSLSNK